VRPELFEHELLLAKLEWSARLHSYQPAIVLELDSPLHIKSPLLSSRPPAGFGSDASGLGVYTSVAPTASWRARSTWRAPARRSRSASCSRWTRRKCAAVTPDAWI